jgi:two-component system cell cycle sensor histidine kinase/response regulator CckA
LTGYTQGEAVGQKPGELLKSGAHNDAHYQAMWATLDGGRQWRGEVTNRRKDGSTYEEDLTITPVVDATGRVTHFVAIKVDLTEPHRVARQFLQAQKMEVVGRLAGGVAHDFNNLLTVINGTAELALADRDAGDPLRQDLERVLEAGERAAALTKQLLAFSRHEIAVREVLDAGAMVSDLRRLLVRLIGEDIRVSVSIVDGATVLVDRSHFEQVILNLVVNARDAMPGGGTLHLDVTTTTIDTAVLSRPCPLAPGRYVRIAVTDEGGGMTADTMTHIFEPFFTTKEAGTGTGLGLATVYSIVEESGGAIIVESAVGTGTTFQILLPCAAAVPAAVRTMHGNVSSGTETLLLVEDDDALRAVAVRMLRTAGYSVLDAADASSALQIVSDPAERIDLVVTDVVLPGMGGRDLAAQIALTRPGLPVLFTSGYTDDHELARGVRDNAAYFIGKPYSAAGLAGKVRGILDRVVEQRSA